VRYVGTVVSFRINKQYSSGNDDFLTRAAVPKAPEMEPSGIRLKIAATSFEGVSGLRYSIILAIVD
jgi:hypothetical protein